MMATVGIVLDGAVSLSSDQCDRSVIWDIMASNRDQEPAAAPVARLSCLKTSAANNQQQRHSDTQRVSSGSGTKKSVTFPLDVLFRAAVKGHRAVEVASIVNLLVPPQLADRAGVSTSTVDLQQPSGSRRTQQVAQALVAEVRLRLDLIQIDVASATGYTALMLCARYGHVRAARTLLVAGADARRRTRGGWTVFHLVAVCGTVEMMRCLLANCGLCYQDMLQILSSVERQCATALAKLDKMRALLMPSVDYLSQQVKSGRGSHLEQSCSHQGIHTMQSTRSEKKPVVLVL